MRSFEIFAGCGGLALGMARAGFGHDAVVEFDRDAVNTLEDNRRRGIDHVRHWKIDHVDVRDIDYARMSQVDVVSGGPPCQPFSIGGKHLGARDPRNMWPEAIRAIRELSPRAFVLENVRGLFRPAFAPYLDYITLQLSYPQLAPRPDEFWEDHLARLQLHRLADGGRTKAYRVLSKAVNAADYGAAQKRHRAIFIGIRADHGDDWEFPSATHSQEALAWAKHVDLSYWKRHDVRRVLAPSSTAEAQALKRAIDRGSAPAEKPWVTVRDAIGDLPLPTKSEFIAGHWQHPGAKAYRNHTGSSPDEPAKALKAGDHGVPGGENMVVNRRGNVRYFTVREMARLQGFPDDFNVVGSWKAATRQLGNAVPTVMAEVMANAVRAILDNGATG
ncbi:DNA cytosine methyltransferase [Sphingopyxis sp.]|uniref:DNA cytosine methyltransferase n=1 Tax=Sphingopyxis sp. TaxID=1908224 RepID=UPI002B49F791|nr:DNA cytosine methyltransferase [Sphingopyxis sp.]HJS10180.1 DNA cytosine methyltransferase [Sphingopyxis sp.]